MVSTAIETGNRDLERAQANSAWPRSTAPNCWPTLFHECKRGIAVTGSFGKTSITGMIGWTLQSAGYRPTVINGGIMRNFETETDVGNAVAGDGGMACIEADESDGTCVNYRPSIGVITGFARDHKELGELHRLYSAFGRNTARRWCSARRRARACSGCPGRGA